MSNDETTHYYTLVATSNPLIREWIDAARTWSSTHRVSSLTSIALAAVLPNCRPWAGVLSLSGPDAVNAMASVLRDKYASSAHTAALGLIDDLKVTRGDAICALDADLSNICVRYDASVATYTDDSVSLAHRFFGMCVRHRLGGCSMVLHSIGAVEYYSLADFPVLTSDARLALGVLRQASNSSKRSKQPPS